MELLARTQKLQISLTTVTWMGFICVCGIFLGYAFLFKDKEVTSQDLLRAELRYLRAENKTLTERNRELEQYSPALRQGDQHTGAEVIRGDSELEQKKQRSFLYTVKKGDTIWDIAITYKVDVEALMRWNNLTRQSRIYPGDTLIIILEE